MARTVWDVQVVSASFTVPAGQGKGCLHAGLEAQYAKVMDARMRF